MRNVLIFCILCISFAKAEENYKFEFTNIYSFDVAGAPLDEVDGASWRVHSVTRILLLDFISSDLLVVNKFDKDSRDFVFNFIKQRFTKKEYFAFCLEHLGKIDTVEIQGKPATVVFLIERGISKLVIKMPKKDIFTATTDSSMAQNQVNKLIGKFVEEVYK